MDMNIQSSSSHQPGGKQGCLLSPNIFCLFINEVAGEIRKARRHGILLSNLIKEILSPLFADDVALVSYTPMELKIN